MKAIIFFGTLLLAGLCLGQSGLQFEKVRHDFGEIKEQDGAAEYTFRFVNNSSDTLKITGVRTSCGCTTPGWTKEAITPGDSGYVTASYNPYNRPGPFNKTLRVSASDRTTTTLYIKGIVKPRPRTIADDLPTKLGAMRIKYRSLNVGKITTEKEVSKVFVIYNDSDSAFTFVDGEGVYPGHVNVTFDPETLAPKEKGLIVVNYDPTVKGELGFNSDQLVIKTTDPLMQSKSFSVVATIEEYFPPMSEEELANAPKLVFNKDLLDFGVIQDENAEGEFILTNEGKSPLNIRAVKSNCSCVGVKLDKEDLKAGESITMKVTFNPQRRRGRQYKTVTVFSSDPRSPTQVLSIKADVKR